MQSNTLRPYLLAVRSSLTAALCLENFASQVVERHNKPEVEARVSKEVLLAPLIISRNENERVLIESSINSLRFSIAIKQVDEVEKLLVHKFMRFLMMRAEGFVILRRKPVQVRNISYTCPLHIRRQIISTHRGPSPKWSLRLGLRYFLLNYKQSYGIHV